MAKIKEEKQNNENLLAASRKQINDMTNRRSVLLDNLAGHDNDDDYLLQKNPSKTGESPIEEVPEQLYEQSQGSMEDGMSEACEDPFENFTTDAEDALEELEDEE